MREVCRPRITGGVVMATMAEGPSHIKVTSPQDCIYKDME